RRHRPCLPSGSARVLPAREDVVALGRGTDRPLMRLHICAVGRLRSGPERDLISDYLERFNRTGRPLGLGPVQEHEVEDKKGGGMASEAALLSRVLPAGAVLICMDERGSTPTSPDFAADLARFR